MIGVEIPNPDTNTTFIQVQSIVLPEGAVQQIEGIWYLAETAEDGKVLFTTLTSSLPLARSLCVAGSPSIAFCLTLALSLCLALREIE